MSLARGKGEGGLLLAYALGYKQERNKDKEVLGLGAKCKSISLGMW